MPVRLTMNKQILIINTGGTISSIETAKGYRPEPGVVGSFLSQWPDLKQKNMPTYRLIELNPLLDSSNLSVTHWNELGTLIAAHYHEVDGFIILHGTDTLAYTASALSFMLENLAKPVILTGAQIPLSAIRSDGRSNLIDALQLATNEKLSEVAIYFNQRLLRGVRATKASSSQFSAFASPSYPVLAKVGIDISWSVNDLWAEKANKLLQLVPYTPQLIANFRLCPGFSSEILKAIIQLPIKALILESYGSGNVPVTDQVFLDLIKQAVDNQVIVVNSSQCFQGRVDMDQYETGQALKPLGVVGGLDMTIEALYCKLQYLLSKSLTMTQLKTALLKNMRGELSAE